MKLFRKLCSLWRKEAPEAQIQTERVRLFREYREAAPEILRYLRREKGIARRDLELIVIDYEEEPAWQIRQLIERLLPEVRMLTIVSGRQTYFHELAQEAFGEYGLLVVVTDSCDAKPAGNLILDLGDWEKQLDILPGEGYNNISNQ
ncbi:MAG: hypothetical protein LUC98_11765 [Lachnospiraceae bacterium]|nr:hypothetical protein [Lachnospiraceae bacterium]